MKPALISIVLVCAINDARNALAEMPGEAEQMIVIPVIIEKKPAEVSIKDVLRSVDKAVERRHRLRTIRFDELFADGEAGLNRMRDCGTDAECLSDRLSVYQVRIALIVLVNLAVEPPLLALRVLDTASKRFTASSIGPLEKDTPAPAAIESRARAVLDQAGYAAYVRLLVHTKPADAHVRVNDRSPEEARPNVFDLPPGRYVVVAEREGYESQRSEIELAPDVDRDVELELSESAGIIESPWLWIAAGAAVVAISAGVFFAVHKSNVCVCAGLPNSACNC